MSDIEGARKALLTRILDGRGQASNEQRRAAFDNARLDGAVAGLVQKVATRAYQVTDEDIAAVRASGLSEDQIFELVICAAAGQATRQYQAALRALDAADDEGSQHAT